MAIKDIAQNLKNVFTKTDTTTPTSVEAGSVGTSLFSGVLDVEFNTDLQFPASITVFDTMKKGDGTVQAILEAIKAPILSAKHFIQPGGKTPKDQKLADFVTECLFTKMNDGDYKGFIDEALGFLENGFYYFEKVFGVDEAGFIYWKRFAPRIPSAHYKWEMQSKAKWIDGHPSGITQQLPGKTDDAKSENSQLEIPWGKLIMFTNKKKGNNYEGTSVLRAAYKHWYYKDLLYKIQGISAERFGVGLPVAKYPSGASKQIKTKLEELLKNIRTNEQAYAVIENNIELEILMPSGDPKAGAIDNAIAHHDKKIYDSIMAGFLNLSTGQGGSNALSQDQSAFFLRSLQGVADYIESVVNSEIRELVDLNFQGVVDYPKLQISEIAQTNAEETLRAMQIAVTGGFIHPTDDDEVAVRERLGLPSRTPEELKQEREEREEKAKDMLPDEVPPGPGEKKPEEKKPEAPKKEEPKEVEDKEKQLADQKKKSRPSPREVEFTKNITAFEKYLDGEYRNKFEPLIKKAELTYQRILKTIYESADTERRDGVVVLASTVHNRELQRKASKAIKIVTGRLNEKLINGNMQKSLFSKTKHMAVSTLKANNKKLSDIFVDAGQFNSFIAGYVSNIKGILFNEPRRIEEDLILNFGSGAALVLVLTQAEAIAFNRNILELSVVTHARSAYENIITDQAIRDGFVFYKVVVPKNKIAGVSPFGIIAALLFGIYTIAQLNKRMNKDSDGKNAASVGGLGLHHGSYEYYYPIESDMMDEEKAISQEQRKQFEQMNK